MTAAELQALADKYDALVRLRSARDDGEAHPAAGVLRGLSQSFPGCLRELDTLGLGELTRRAAACHAAVAGGPREPWMDWIHAFHRLLGAALLVKRATSARAGGRSHDGRPGDGAQLADAAAAHAGVPIAAAELASYARPPGGRLAPLVLGEVADRFAVARDEVAQTLFPPRRRA